MGFKKDHLSFFSSSLGCASVRGTVNEWTTARRAEWMPGGRRLRAPAAPSIRTCLLGCLPTTMTWQYAIGWKPVEPPLRHTAINRCAWPQGQPRSFFSSYFEIVKKNCDFEQETRLIFLRNFMKLWMAWNNEEVI